MALFRSPSQTASAAAKQGRNDPCPCGSGRKYKHCCAGKASAVAGAQAAPNPLEQIRSLCDAGRFLEATRLAQAYTLQNPGDAAGHSSLGAVHLRAGRTEDAARSFTQAVRLAPNVAKHHYDLGWVLQALGRDNDAGNAFQRVIALDPQHAEALEGLGLLLASYDKPAEAIDCFRRAAQAQPNTVLGRICGAKVLLDEGKRGQAVALLQAAAEAFPANGETKRFLASLLREEGRFDEAISLLEAATEGTPLEAATAYFDIAMSKRMTKEDEPAIEQMNALLDYKPLSDVGRQRVHFALGKTCDDLGDYAAAMRHFDAGNRLVGRTRPFDRAHFGASVHRMITGSTSTPEFFQQHRDLASSSELPVLILGMPRSGTTLVEQILSSHPKVGAGDELPFWNRTAEAFSRLGESESRKDFFARVTSEYEAELRAIAPGASRVTDKMPGNYLWIGLIHLAFPKARIIHCRRHPVDTCLSNYFTNFSSPLPFTYDKGHLAFYYRCYERMMAHWAAVIPEGTILDVDYEELVADREQVTRRMIDFLGLEWSDACLRPQDNQRIVRTASMWQARQAVYRSSTERWRRYEPWLGPLAELLEEQGAKDPVEPMSDSASIANARRLGEAGRFDEAIAALQKGLQETPHDPVLYNELGGLCMAASMPDSAVDCFERAIGLNPNFAAAHYNLAAALERQGRIPAAIAALRRAIALKPNLGAAYSRLGNLLQTRGDQAEAMACFRQASEYLTEPAEHDLEEAKLRLAEGRSSEAKPLLRNVIELDPGNSLAHAILGDVLGQEGRFDEAVSMLQQAIDLDPERVGAWHNLTMLRKVSDAERPLVEAMEDMLQRSGRPDFDRLMLHFALGKAYDDLGEAEAAMRHFDQGNTLERRRLNFDRGALSEAIDRTIETFTSERMQRAASSSVNDDLPVLIVGMPRSGTTLVEQIVSSHAQVAAGGELTFWTDERAMAAASEATASRLGEDYLALLRRIGPRAARVTDKNPFNFLHLGAIRMAAPGSRFIHCRRDPIDTRLSIYFTRFATAQGFAYDRSDLVFYYRQYERLMAHWRAATPADRLLEIDYEALIADREALTRRMIAFCGLAWDEACLEPERNPAVLRTASVWQARQPVYRTSVERWRRYEPWLGELLQLRADAQ
ncbi:MAG: sulfotransferase [Caulobacteraceae bacterium]|nr:sulfotransferase [Caulobacteraceae bacterium]